MPITRVMVTDDRGTNIWIGFDAFMTEVLSHNVLDDPTFRENVGLIKEISESIQEKPKKSWFRFWK